MTVIDVTTVPAGPGGRGPIVADNPNAAAAARLLTALHNPGRLKLVLKDATHGDTLYFPRGTYYVSEPIVLKPDKRINLTGDGGRTAGKPITQIAASAEFAPCLAANGPGPCEDDMTAIASVPDDPVAKASAIIVFQRPQISGIVHGLNQPHYYDVQHEVPESWNASVKDLDIVGNRGTGTCSGLWIDNKGIRLDSVYVHDCGGHGIIMTWSQCALYTNVGTYHNGLDGLCGVAGYDSRFDAQKGVLRRTNPVVDQFYTDHANEDWVLLYGGIDCNANTFINVQADSNQGSGIHIAAGSGNLFLNPEMDANGVAAIQMGAGAQGGVTQNRFVSAWDENNAASLRFETGKHGKDDGADGASLNAVDFARTDHHPDDPTVYTALPVETGKAVVPPYFSNIIQGPVGTRGLSPLRTALEALAAHTFATVKQDVQPVISIVRTGSNAAAAGDNAAVLGRSHWSGDSGGVIELKTGSANLNHGPLVTVEFARFRLSSPIVLLVPANAAAAAAAGTVYVPAPNTLTGPAPSYAIETGQQFFTVFSSAALQPNTVYVWTWFALEVGNITQVERASVVVLPAPPHR